MISAAVRSTARADSRNGSRGLARIAPAFRSGAKFSTCAVAFSELIRSKRAGLDGCKVRLASARLHVGIQFALKELPHENRRAGFHAKADRVADQHLIEPRGQLRREIAHLVGVREEHNRRIDFADQLLERGRVAVGRVGCQQRMFDSVDPVQLLASQFTGERGNSLPRHRCRNDLSSIARQAVGRLPESPTTCDSRLPPRCSATTKIPPPWLLI